MPYTTDFTNAQNESLLKVIQQAILSVAIDVQAEALTVAYHSQRSMYAAMVLAQPRMQAELMAYAMCTDGAITPASTDAQIKARAVAVWNAFSLNG